MRAVVTLIPTVALRIEWAKTRARSLRWSEEVDLLEEEMRRILRFLTWRADWWEGQVGRRCLPDGPELEGETAYAMRQAAVQSGLHRSFALKWETLPELIRKGRAGEDLGDDEWESDGEEEGEEEGDEEALSENEPIPDSDGRPVKTTYLDV